MWSGDGSTSCTSKYSWPSASALQSRITESGVSGTSASRLRQNTGYDLPSIVRVTYHQPPWSTGTERSVSWTRDLISSNTVSTSAARAGSAKYRSA